MGYMNYKTYVFQNPDIQGARIEITAQSEDEAVAKMCLRIREISSLIELPSSSEWFIIHCRG